jgi:hypothetical protein
MPEFKSNNKKNNIPLLNIRPQIENRGLNPDEHDKYTEGANPQPPAPNAAIRMKFLLWTAIGMAATIGIVFTNKAIFNDPALKLMQTSFASFHFICTGLTLYIVSRKRIGAFVPKRANIVDMLPVCPPFLQDPVINADRRLIAGILNVSERRPPQSFPRLLNRDSLCVIKLTFLGIRMLC